ncbi:hypothetical protein [Aquisalinus flavus]|uniref:Uncharacterized protein n=1 Tax=Aquisalinus flavus TaxID=1526572 RepID=A0A8J2V514_9PROT|nr:hypothetical protein [Aquisalinus flavus]MBD0425541.1 hypothetical protein [Aquisalinus flavus]UNE48832.1 hypothetical protein FF099_12620 [Aquisalinus flavus]GGD15250.1 hypothetical protein GCM10011342_25020 [Aquisalinus flavus]
MRRLMLKTLAATGLVTLATMASACVIIIDKDDDDGRTGTRVYGPGSYDELDRDYGDTDGESGT